MNIARLQYSFCASVLQLCIDPNLSLPYWKILSQICRLQVYIAAWSELEKENKFSISREVTYRCCLNILIPYFLKAILMAFIQYCFSNR